MIDRRAFLGALVVAATAGACGRAAGTPGVVRVGFLANLTHGPMLSSLATGRLASALAGTRIEPRAFRAGPRVGEALLGRAIDVGVAGPSAVLALHARHPGAIRVLAGVCSGGASLVALDDVRGPRDLRGRRVATPQLGSTQDVSLRTWLERVGLAPKERGGDVTLDALAPSDVLTQMARGEIAAAWLPEPWASRVVVELAARRLVDERALWPARRFPSAMLVARADFHDARRVDVDAIAAAIRAEIAWARAASDAPAVVFEAIARRVAKSLPRPITDEAWRRVDFTDDPLPDALAKIAADAARLGYLPSADTSRLFA